MESIHHTFMQIALDEARFGLAEGGLPIGSCLVIDGSVVGRGHNLRVQTGSPILHGEMSALTHAGRLKAADYQRATLYTTLSPCDMCSGTILLYKIPTVVIAENVNFLGAEDLLRARGVQLINLNFAEAIQMMGDFIRLHPQLWHEDIGV